MIRQNPAYEYAKNPRSFRIRYTHRTAPKHAMKIYKLASLAFSDHEKKGLSKKVDNSIKNIT